MRSRFSSFSSARYPDGFPKRTFTKKEIKEAIAEQHEAMEYDNGKHMILTDVRGGVLGGGVGDYVTPTRSKVTFLTPLTEKQKNYCRIASHVGGLNNVIGIGRIMNKENCNFDKAARKYFSTGINI